MLASRTKNRDAAVVCALLGAVTLAVFWRVSSFEFINFDDNSYVSENRFVQSGLNLNSIEAAFTETFNGHWHPLTMLSWDQPHLDPLPD